jgi:hypothetical protein
MFTNLYSKELITTGHSEEIAIKRMHTRITAILNRDIFEVLDKEFKASPFMKISNNKNIPSFVDELIDNFKQISKADNKYYCKVIMEPSNFELLETSALRFSQGWNSFVATRNNRSTFYAEFLDFIADSPVELVLNPTGLQTWGSIFDFYREIEKEKDLEIPYEYDLTDRKYVVGILPQHESQLIFRVVVDGIGQENLAFSVESLTNRNDKTGIIKSPSTTYISDESGYVRIPITDKDDRIVIVNQYNNNRIPGLFSKSLSFKMVRLGNKQINFHSVVHIDYLPEFKAYVQENNFEISTDKSDLKAIVKLDSFSSGKSSIAGFYAKGKMKISVEYLSEKIIDLETDEFECFDKDSEENAINKLGKKSAKQLNDLLKKKLLNK